MDIQSNGPVPPPTPASPPSVVVLSPNTRPRSSSATSPLPPPLPLPPRATSRRATIADSAILGSSGSSSLAGASPSFSVTRTPPPHYHRRSTSLGITSSGYALAPLPALPASPTSSSSTVTTGGPPRQAPNSPYVSAAVARPRARRRRTTATTGGALWSRGLFDCRGHLGTFCCSLALPLAVNAVLRRDYDHSSACGNCFLCLLPCGTRSVIREGYGIDGSCTEDILMTLFCLPCVLTQMYSEVDLRGPIRDAYPLGTNPGRWKSELFSPESQVTFVFAFFCPFCVAAGARSVYDGSDCLFNVMCMNPCIIRNIIREGYGIGGNWWHDIWVSFCMSSCAVAQMHGEAEHRGPICPPSVSRPVQAAMF